MNPGTLVRMRQRLKDELTQNDCAEHVREFGDCVGVVEGLTNYGSCIGPEVDVRWQPSRLRYAYDPKDLEPVETKGGGQ